MSSFIWLLLYLWQRLTLSDRTHRVGTLLPGDEASLQNVRNFRLLIFTQRTYDVQANIIKIPDILINTHKYVHTLIHISILYTDCHELGHFSNSTAQNSIADENDHGKVCKINTSICFSLLEQFQHYFSHT